MTQQPAPESTNEEWPGRSIGLPKTGPGSAAGWARRLLAIFVDWVLSSLVVSVLTGHSVLSPPQGAEQWYPLLVFALEVSILTTTLGGSAGQLLLRLQVRRTSGTRLDVLRAVIRTVLICVVIPAVIYNRDQRGLHDLAVDSVVVRR